MEIEVKKLKLNTTNIKTTLISSNKELRKVRLQKRDLIQNIENKNKVQSEEKRLETRNLGIGSSFQKIASATAPVKSIFDKMLEFFGLIALNILLQELPKILQKIDNFFNSDFMKSVGDIFNTIGSGFQKLGELFGFLPKEKMNEIDKELKDIEKEIEGDDKIIESAEKNLIDLEKEIESQEGYELPAEEIDVPAPVLPIEPETQETPKAQVQPPAQSAPQLQPSEPSKPASDQEKQSFARGGTVKSEDSRGKPQYTPKESGRLRTARRSMQDGFTGFDLAVKTIRDSTEREEKNMMSLSKLSERLMEWGGLMSLLSIRNGGGGGGGSLEDIVAAGDERELLLRLILAEAGGEGKLGMAMVARSVLNRAGLIQGNVVRPGMYNSKSGSLTDVITASGQYQPYADGLLERDLSAKERARAAEALSLAENGTSLKEALKAQGMSDDNIKKLLAATGFRTHGAFFDASQEVNNVSLGGHRFNTAGNSLMRSVQAQIKESSLGDFDGNVISVGKAILAQGFTVGENKYFNKNNWSKQGPNTGGFDPSGRGAVGSHASGDHATNALDITDWRGSEASGIPRLKSLFLSLYSKRQQYGIKSLIYDHIGYWFAGQKNYTKGAYGGHGGHLHVGFTISADIAMRHEQTQAALSSGSRGAGGGKSGGKEVVVIRQQTQVAKPVPVPYPVAVGR